MKYIFLIYATLITLAVLYFIAAYVKERRSDKIKALSYQKRVHQWVTDCFGAGIANDINERSLRFIEEAIELVQACGMRQKDVQMMVDYVFDRPVGETHQEVGGVQVTFASLCAAAKIDMLNEGERELHRVSSMNQDMMLDRWLNKPKCENRFGKMSSFDGLPEHIRAELNTQEKEKH